MIKVARMRKSLFHFSVYLCPSFILCYVMLLQIYDTFTPHIVMKQIVNNLNLYKFL